MTELVKGKNGNRRSWLAKVFAWIRVRSRSFQVRRLQAELEAYKAELETRLQTAPREDSTSAAISMVAQAQTALAEGKVDQAWLTYDAARRHEIESLNHQQLDLEAKSLLAESQKLGSKWRQKAILEILGKSSGVDVDSVRKAMEIRDQHLENTHLKISNFADQLSFLAITAVALLGLIVLLAYKGAFMCPLDPGDWIRLLVVICYGALGGTVSTMLSLSPKGIEPRIPVQTITSALARARPIMGAAAAVAVDAFWRTGFISIKAPPGVDYMAISFVAGFSDRLLLSAINKTFGLEPSKPGAPEGVEQKKGLKDAMAPKSNQEVAKRKPREKDTLEKAAKETTPPESS